MITTMLRMMPGGGRFVAVVRVVMMMLTMMPGAGRRRRLVAASRSSAQGLDCPLTHSLTLIILFTIENYLATQRILNLTMRS